MRVRPRRETRGVSRSKCGDLITATVPVTWATSIIVNESTDAIDYYDGFGTTELVVGIRAYQWGWEYYYPKDIDLNYNIKPNYSTFVGNSLKYTRSADVNLHSNNVWKFYQNKAFDHVVTPAHLLALPLDNNKVLNFLNFNDIGSNTVYESNAFKKIRMFSKTYTNNLVFTPNEFSAKYKLVSQMYLNKNQYVDSANYGLKRQHGFLTNLSLFNNNLTFLNLKNADKLIEINFQKSPTAPYSVNSRNSQFFLSKANNSVIANSPLNFATYLDNNCSSIEMTAFKNLNTYSNVLTVFNDDSDVKKINNPFVKLFNNEPFTQNNLIAYKDVNQLNSDNDLTIFADNDTNKFFFENNATTHKNYLLFSNNQTVATANKNIRNFLNTSPQNLNLNYSTEINTINHLFSSTIKGFNNNNLFFYNKVSNNSVDLITTNKFMTSRVNYDYPYSPIASNNPAVNTLNHDSHKFTFIEGTPSVLQGKEELMPNFLQSIYWNFYWLSSTPSLRLSNVQNLNNLNTIFYLPLFTLYYDYDFRNWQALELLEDSFWESAYSIYSHDEYLLLAKDFYSTEYFEKITNHYNFFERNNSDSKTNTVLPTVFKDHTLSSSNTTYPNYFFLEDGISHPSTQAFKNFSIFPNSSLSSSIDDSYDTFKNLNYLHNLTTKIALNVFSAKTNHSHFFVLDSFRSDFDEFSWYIDENSNASVLLNFIDEKKNNFFDNELFVLNTDLSQDKITRFSNNVNLRNTAKNAVVTYNAIQKIFKTRFDEGRSHTKINDFGNFYTKQPLISSDRTSYETILKKNKENFFKINFYKNSFKPFFNSFYSLATSLNFYFYDFPFLLALKSDSSRYLWFDWFAKWGYYEVQPSSSSRYAIHGMPYFSKNFEFSTTNGETLNESENYLTRLAKSRRNYLPNWTYTPYFYSKNNSWYKNNLTFEILNSTSTLSATKGLLHNSSWYWKSSSVKKTNNYQFSSSNSNITSYARVATHSQNSIQSYYYNVSTLVDILTKREYLYRHFLATNNKIINLPSYLVNSPKNPLLREIKATFAFIDPINCNNEYSRNAHYHSLNFFNHTVFKVLFTEKFVQYGSQFFDFLFNFTNKNVFSDNNELYKNQYRPMRKGVTNMIRLHATGAMALPIEIRLQVLASSKDVIHSWAIPSAGIKIDCVPGYSSHRVMIFLVSGIFWGQCMEVCGRYHHWMPIVVYFMKRDLFFLWCTHFIFLSGANNGWTINDKQYSDYIRLASFDKNTWLSELNS
jgi:hypothetical protein